MDDTGFEFFRRGKKRPEKLVIDPKETKKEFEYEDYTEFEKFTVTYEEDEQQNYAESPNEIE